MVPRIPAVPNGLLKTIFEPFLEFGHFDDEFPIVQVSKKPGLAGLLLEFRWQWQLRWIECLLGILPQIKSGPGLYRYQRTIGKKKPDGTVFFGGQNRFFFDFLPTELESKSTKNSSSRLRQVA